MKVLKNLKKFHRFLRPVGEESDGALHGSNRSGGPDWECMERINRSSREEFIGQSTIGCAASTG